MNALQYLIVASVADALLAGLLLGWLLALLVGLLLGWLLYPWTSVWTLRRVNRRYFRRMRRENNAIRQNQIEGIVQQSRRDKPAKPMDQN